MENTDPTHRRPQPGSPNESDKHAGDHAATQERGASSRATTADQEYITEERDHTTRDVFLGTDEHRNGVANVSWGAIFAGVVTFIALMFVFGLVSLGLGLSEAGGIAVGIWSALEDTEITTEDLGAAAEDADVDEAQQQAEDTAQEAQDDLEAGAWWSVAGLLIGAVVAGLAGAAGSAAAHTRNETVRTESRRTVR